MKPESVIFDIDGLMFDTEKVWLSCWEPALVQMGLATKPGISDATRGTAGDQFAHVILKWYGPSVDAQRLWDIWHELANERFEHDVEKKPGLDELLAYLDERKVPMAVASSSICKHIEHHLNSSGVRKFFDVVLCSEEVPHAKPESDVFLEAARQLGSSPTHSLVLEDSYNGVRAGAAGGFHTVMVPDMSEPTEEMEHLADRICPTLLTVRDLLATGELI